MQNNRSLANFKLPTFILLLTIWGATLLDLTWLWGLLFLYWGIIDLWSGQSHAVEALSRQDNPLWYWLVVLTWILVGAFYIVGGLLNWW